MTSDKPRRSPTMPTRERVLDAAERLLIQDGASFSMRELADEAGVSFATPFNQFGNKAGIMQALSAARITSMRERLTQAALPARAVSRVLAAVEIAVTVMLEAPGLNRAVMGALGTPSDDPGNVLARSSALWAEALADGEGLAQATRIRALAVPPDQLAFAFRGVLSFWTAGELDDDMLGRRARTAAAVVLLGFVGREDHAEVLTLLRK